MCYKAEVQKRNEEKLNKMLKNENVPDLIQDYFLSISSRAARINYWTTIRNTLNWLIENKYIECETISDITPETLDKVTDSKIIRYLDYLKETGIKLSTLVTKKNQLSSFWQWMKERHYCKDNIIQLIKSNEYKAMTKYFYSSYAMAAVMLSSPPASYSSARVVSYPQTVQTPFSSPASFFVAARTTLHWKLWAALSFCSPH